MAISERFQGANVIDAGRLSPYWGEHASRYVRALKFVDGGRVLDIACGTGYGVALLSSEADLVLGVDVDPVAAREALGECGSNSAVLLGNGLGLPIADESFDIVTSFETLEHLHERGKFLAELYRVLKLEGVLLLSTPNANYTRPVDGKPENPFHIHEYTPGELRAEIEQHFEITEMLGQVLDPSTGVPPFLQAQRQLPNDLATQTRLFGWRVFNKIPLGARESLSSIIWGKPFYPTEMDYNFSEAAVEDAPTLFVVCRKVV